MPAYSRLDVDERRRQLLEAGARLFTEHHYDELTMSQIAAETGVSKGLLYHYFPSKAVARRDAGSRSAMLHTPARDSCTHKARDYPQLKTSRYAFLR